MQKLYKLSLLFYKYAVETPNWMPEDVKSEMAKIENIEKDPKLKPFRTKLEGYASQLIQNQNETFLENIKSEINIQYGITDNMVNFIKKFNLKYLKEFTDIKTNLNIFNNTINEENLNDNKININKNIFKISKYYSLLFKALEALLIKFVDYYNKILRTIYADYYNENITSEIIPMKDVNEFNYILTNNLEKISTIDSFDEIPGKKDWDNRLNFKDYYVIFTTNYVDILGMSSRSNWTSCQDIRPTKESKDSDFYQSLIGSAFEPSVGMIYITDGEETKYGENIITRSVVWLIKEKETNKSLLSLQNIYPQNTELISNIFKKELKENIGFDVINIDIDDLDPKKYHTSFTEQYTKPYDDIGIVNETNLEQIDDLKDDLIDLIVNDIIKHIYSEKNSETIKKEITLATKKQINNEIITNDSIEKFINDNFKNIITLLYIYIRKNIDNKNTYIGKYFYDNSLATYLIDKTYNSFYYESIINALSINPNDFISFLKKKLPNYNPSYDELLNLVAKIITTYFA